MSKNKIKRPFSFYWEKLGTLAILLILIVITAIFAPSTYLSKGNILQILTQSATIMLIGMGEFFAILIGGIDLSVGSTMAMSGVVIANLMVAGVHWILAFIIGGILVGGLLGAINGGLINLTRVPPFIITLGTQSIFRGLTLIVSNAQPTFGFSQTYKTAFGGMINGWLSMPVVVALIVALVLYFVATKTDLGRNFYAMGGNEEAAWYSGINTKLHTLIVFTISGICAGIAGAVMIARLGSAEPTAGIGEDTNAIAAAIIGGTSFSGGKGNIPNVVIGAIIIGAINNALNMLGVESYYQQVATGAIIIIAVTIDGFISRTNK